MILALGSMVETARKTGIILAEKGVQASIVNMRFVSPPDIATIVRYGRNSKLIVTMEENIRRGGFGALVSDILYEHCENRPEHLIVGLPDRFLEQGTIDELRAENAMDAVSVAERIMNKL